MKKYLVRVQLTSETNARYTLVRDRLLNVGFTKRVKSKEGVEYRLPTGNYYTECKNTTDEVYTIVANLVFGIDKRAMIVISRVSDEPHSMSWANLQVC